MLNQALPEAYLAPAFAAEFACIGSECSVNCCDANWRIFVDKYSFAKYHAIPDTDPIKLKLQRNLKKLPDSTRTEATYGQLITASGRCPFLNSDKLCSLQLQFGESILCNTCKIFPRIDFLVNGQAYRGMTTACEAVSRIALPKKDGIDFAYYPLNDGTLFLPSTFFSRTSDMFTSGTAPYYQDLLDFMIDTLQNREYRLWERLVLLGMFMRRIDAIEQDDILSAIRGYSAFYSSPDAAAQLSQIPGANGFHVYIATLAGFMTIECQSSLDVKLAMLCKNAFDGLGYSPELTNIDRIDNYTEAYKRYYLPWLYENEHFMENFLVMEIFNSPQHLVLFNKGQAFSGYKKLALLYGLTRFLMVGTAAYNKGMTSDVAINTLTLISHHFGIVQSNAVRRGGLSLTEAAHTDSMAWFASMLKE